MAISTLDGKKLNNAMAIFKKLDISGMLNDMEARIDAVEAGEVGELSIGNDSVTTAMIQANAVTIAKVSAGITTSLGKADSALNSVTNKAVVVAAASAAGTLADLAAAETKIDALKDKINAILTALKNAGLMATA